MDTLTPDLQEMLLRSARLHRMCGENREALRACTTKQQAVDLYKKTIDWALEENYPTINVLRKDFSDCEQYGIFVDKHFSSELLNDELVYVFHNCTGVVTIDLNVEAGIIPMLYFANGCHVTIRRADDCVDCHIRVPVYVFGDNSVRVENDANTDFSIYEFDVKQS